MSSSTRRRSMSESGAHQASTLSDEEQELVDVIFKGLEKPRTAADATEQCIAGYVFLAQLAEVDRLLAAALADSDFGARPSGADTSSRVWQALGAALFDFGLEIPDEDLFAIIAGQLHVAAQLSNDIQRINDRGHAFALLQSVGPRVPLRQRINPFQPQVTAVKGTIPQATRVYLQEQPRFSKKRAICVDNLERLRDKEMKQQKIKEKRERELAAKTAEAQRSAEAQAHKMEQDEFLTNKYASDPKLMAEKTKRTELLRELERLETEFSNDERLLSKLKREAAMDSPRRVAPTAASPIAQQAFMLTNAEKRGPLNPVRLREPSAIPFAAGSTSQSPQHNASASPAKGKTKGTTKRR